MGRIENSELTEVSGIAASRTRDGALYVHNDSGDSPRFFAIDRQGHTLLEIGIPIPSWIDCEDIAVGPAPGVAHAVYLGDIGDNAARESRPSPRSEIQVYRVPEPAELANAKGGRIRLPKVDTLRFVYPDKPHDAETLMIDPVSGDLFIVTKESDGRSVVFLAAAPLTAGGPRALTPVGGLAFGGADLPGNGQATGGDISPSGDAIVIRTYSTVFLWRRAAGQNVGDALKGRPQALPTATEPQGEAVGFAADGNGFFTASEKPNQPLFFAGCR
ncbi:MAG TPA: hypothetical protein VGJ84_21810 [Polyangiaceae bacterium]